MITRSVDDITNWVYVTGLIRSGTTFVGKVLSLPIEVDYIHEPFNKGCGMPGMTRRYYYVRPGLDTADMRRYHELTSRIFRYDFVLRTPTYKKDPWLRRATKSLIGSRGPFYLWLAKLNPFHRAAVIKDPTGPLLTEYLYCRFGVKPVIVIKHPVSFIASLERVGWWPDLSPIREQQPLVEDYFSSEADFLNRRAPDPALAAAAHWRAIHKVLLAQARRHPSWQIVTHEELSRSPQATFERLYHALGLPWSERVARSIDRMTNRKGAAEARRGKVQDLHRTSADIFRMRRDSVPLETRRAIFEAVEDVALQLYTRESFAIDP